MTQIIILYTLEITFPFIREGVPCPIRRQNSFHTARDPPVSLTYDTFFSEIVPGRDTSVCRAPYKIHTLAYLKSVAEARFFLFEWYSTIVVFIKEFNCLSIGVSIVTMNSKAS